MKISFLLQTTKDYDMEYEEVEKIYKKSNGENFYEELENFIKERAKR